MPPPVTTPQRMSAAYFDKRKQNLATRARELGAQYSEATDAATKSIRCRLVEADGKELELFYSPISLFTRDEVYDRMGLRLALISMSRTRKTGGVNDAARVLCTFSRHHGYHPANEKCRYCP